MRHSRHSHASRQVDSGANLKVVSEIFFGTPQLFIHIRLHPGGAETTAQRGAGGAAMNRIFLGPIAGELHGFLQFKRSLGYRYRRAESACANSTSSSPAMPAKIQDGNLIAPPSLGCRASPNASQ